MDVNLEESQAARFAVMQYIAMLKRMPEATLREQFNNNDAIIVGGVGTVPFPHAAHYVQNRELSLAYNPRAGAASPNTILSPSKSIVGRLPSGQKDEKKTILPSAVQVESKPTIVQLEMLLRALGSSTADCVTTNDYAVRLYRNLDRYFDLSAEISGATTKLRRALGTGGFPSSDSERKIREKIKAKLGASDGSPSSLADAQKQLAKAQDRIRDMTSTIERLRGVKADIVLLQEQARNLRETCAAVKQTTRFQLLDMQDFLSDQSTRLRGLVGSDAIRSTGIAGGGINAAKKAALEEEIKKMKAQNPLRDAASVLKLTLESTLDELRRVLRAPLDPTKPVEDSDEEEAAPKGKKKAAAAGAAGGGATGQPRRIKPNCAAQAIKHEIRLPKVDLVNIGWDTLTTYDKPGAELDLLKEARSSLKGLLQMQKLMSQWFVDHSQTTSTINGLKHEIESLTEQLAAAKEEAAAVSKSGPKAKEEGKPGKAQGANSEPVSQRSGGKEKAKTSGSSSPPPPASPKGKPGVAKAAPAKPARKGSFSSPSAAASFEEPEAAGETAAPSEPSAAPPLLPGNTEAEEANVTATSAAVDASLTEVSLSVGEGMVEVDTTHENPLGSPMSEHSPGSPSASGVEAPPLFAIQQQEGLPPLTSNIDTIGNSINATSSTTSAAPAAPRSKASATKKAPPNPSLARKNSVKQPQHGPSGKGPSQPPHGSTPDALSDKTSSGTTPRPLNAGHDDVRSNASRTISPCPTPGRGGGRGLEESFRLQSLFLEISALGIPRHLGRLLEELYAVLFPGDPRVHLIRRATVASERDEVVLGQIAKPLPTLTPGPAMEMMNDASTVLMDDTVSRTLLPPHDCTSTLERGEEEQQGMLGSVTSTESAAAKSSSTTHRAGSLRGSRKFGASSSSSKDLSTTTTAVVEDPPPAAVRNEDIVTPRNQQSSEPTAAAVSPPIPARTPSVRFTKVESAHSSAVKTTPSMSTQSGALTGEGSLTTTPAALQRQPSLRTDQSAVTDDEPHCGGGAISDAFPTGLLDAASLYTQKSLSHAGGSAGNPNTTSRPISQIRQLRDKFAPKYKAPPTMEELVDTVDKDPAFEKRKEKFVELTRKLLADLPVLRRSPPKHPLSDVEVPLPSPPLLFAPSRQFPPK